MNVGYIIIGYKEGYTKVRRINRTRFELVKRHYLDEGD